MIFGIQIFAFLYYISLCNSQIAFTVPQPVSSDVTNLDIDDLKKLYGKLLNESEYDIWIRPRRNQSHHVEVNTTFTPTNIIRFDTTEQRLDVLGYFITSWKDELLTWKPDEYSGTNTVKLPISKIWKPTLVLAKAYQGSNIIGDAATDIAKLSSEGILQWVPDGIYSVLCEVNVEWYPFDVQTCKMTYFVSDETISTVLLNGPESVPTYKYIENSEWRLLELTTEREVMYETYMVHMIFKVERRAQFTVYTLVVPLMMLSSLNVFVFLMPIGSGEKASTSITIFLAYGVLTTVIRDTLPHNSLNISYFVVYIVFLLSVSVLTVMYVIVQAKIYSGRGDQPCRLCCYVSNKIAAVNSETTTGVKENPRNTNITWTMFFNTLDTIIFFIFFILVVIATAGLFCMYNARN